MDRMVVVLLVGAVREPPLLLPSERRGPLCPTDISSVNGGNPDAPPLRSEFCDCLIEIGGVWLLLG